MSGHSLAFSTGTRVDSAAKHIMACKIDSQLMKAYAGEKDVTLQGLDHAKLDFLTEKDDLVMNACQKLFKAGDGAMHAYPPVISHMGKCKDHMRFFMKWLYSLRGHMIWDAIGEMNRHAGSARTKVIALYDNYKDATLTTMLQATVQAEIDKLLAEDPADPNVSLFEMELRETAFLQMQGYALGRAFASSISGDTVFSVLIGGCATVLNGHFPMQTGQLVQWYFGFESSMFHANTELVPGAVGVSQAGSRKQNQLALAPAAGGRLTAAMKRRRLEEPKRLEGHFFFPKAFVPDPNGKYHVPDRMRIFAKCINGGHAFEPVDIMIMTQSL